jgi:hypothetical protein
MRPEERIDEPSQTDLDSATQGAINQLLKRDIEVPDHADPATIVDLWNAVDEFEADAASRGCDSLTNAPDSSPPEDQTCVLPRQLGDESVSDYARRIRQAIVNG